MSFHATEGREDALKAAACLFKAGLLTEKTQLIPYGIDEKEPRPGFTTFKEASSTGTLTDVWVDYNNPMRNQVIFHWVPPVEPGKRGSYATYIDVPWSSGVGVPLWTTPFLSSGAAVECVRNAASR